MTDSASSKEYGQLTLVSVSRKRGRLVKSDSSVSRSSSRCRRQEAHPAGNQLSLTSATSNRHRPKSHPADLCSSESPGLSPMSHYVHQNLTTPFQFEVVDADEEWTFTREFDLVHTRIMNDFTLTDCEWCRRHPLDFLPFMKLTDSLRLQGRTSTNRLFGTNPSLRLPFMHTCSRLESLSIT